MDYERFDDDLTNKFDLKLKVFLKRKSFSTEKPLSFYIALSFC
ncbi:hypothetical protein HMPREF0322_01669 [Desulfitobacterium hafniense DP7]|uniref:Uncharacterized protein n=1 Tax=Desulfitobacterium hafniense DP7 TaxID=537010 RepID=G9XL35_DESHA|nr:hypothetical protein HMPREF0322_01669 [Desulfitobacterium hafniense DP7]